MQNNKYKRLAIDTVLFAIGNFGSKILIFLLTPLYTAVLTTEQYGIADLITTTVQFLYPVLTLAISEAALRFAMDKNASKQGVFINSMFFTLIASAGLVVAYPVIGFFNAELKQYWFIFIVLYISFNLHNTLSYFIKGLGKTKLFAVQSILQTVTIILCNIYFLLVAKIGLNGYFWSIVIGHFVPSVLILVAGKMHRYLLPLRLDKMLLKEMLSYSLPMIPTVLAWAVNTSIDKYMIIGMIGLGASGIYSVAHKIPTIVTTVTTVFTQAWQLSAISNRGAKDESEYYTEMYQVFHIICLLMCVALIPFSKLLSGLLFTSDYYSAWRFIPFLTISSFFSSLSGFLAALFRAAKRTEILFWSVAFGAGINIVLNLILLYALGTIGAAIGTATGFFATWLMRFVTAQKVVRIKIHTTKTILTYFLLLGEAFFYSFDIAHALIFFVVTVIGIVLINARDAYSIIRKLFLFILQKMRKKRHLNSNNIH